MQSMFHKVQEGLSQTEKRAVSIIMRDVEY
jgi:hypothetical protein